MVTKSDLMREIARRTEAARERGDHKAVEILAAAYLQINDERIADRIEEERDAEVSRSNVKAICDRAAELARIPVDQRIGRAFDESVELTHAERFGGGETV